MRTNSRTTSMRTGSLISSFADSFTNNSNKDQTSVENRGDGLLANQPQKLNLKNDNAIKHFWSSNCKAVPMTRFAKIGDHVRENEHLVF